MLELVDALQELRTSHGRAVLATVIDTAGSTPRKAGAHLLVRADGRTTGTVGGGALEHRVLSLAPEVLAEGRCRLVDLDLSGDLGMGCGGHVTVYFEPLGLADRLLVVGAGHIGQHLCDLATRCGFAVTVADSRAELRSRERFPGAVALLPEATPDALAAWVTAPGETWIVVVTHAHALDLELVTALLPRAPRYLGMIGSRRKRVKLEQHLRERGFPAERIAAVRCPVGLPLGGETPAEIAISIVAELVSERAQSSTGPKPCAG